MLYNLRFKLRDHLKFLLTLLVPVASAFASPMEPPVPQCFKVHSLIRMDEEHYWANWTNACPYTIDSVYVMVKFAGRSGAGADGVWALHFVTPGTHQVMRLSTPMGLADYDTVHVARITTDSAEALHIEKIPQYLASRDPNAVADPGPNVEPAPKPRQIQDTGPIPAPQVVTAVNPEPSEPSAPVVLPAPVAPPPHIDSESASEHHSRGRELLQKGKYREAIEELSEAILKKPDFALAYNARGYAHYLLRQYRQALADLDEAIRLNPKYLNAYQNRSRARKAAGDKAGSSADGKQAMVLARLTTE